MRAFVVDTFTPVRFRGNPTGVVLLDGGADTPWMQQVAAEFNCPATAFVGPLDGTGWRDQHGVSG